MKIEKYTLHLFQAEQDKNTTYTDKLTGNSFNTSIGGNKLQL